MPIYHCKICDLYFTGRSPKEIKNRLSNIYDERYWSERNSLNSIISNYTDTDSLGKKRNWISQFAYCKPYIKNKKKLLEIGVGAGQSLFWFETAGFDVTGVEPDVKNVNLINKKLTKGKCIPSYVEDLQIDEKFEIIWMSHVLEHLVQPDLFIQKVKKNLTSDGIFFVEVPNCENKFMLEKSINEPHIFHFSKNSLLHLVKSAGFTVKCCDYFRPATLIEGGLNKISKKISKLENTYPYYPRILTNYKKGRDLRIILSL